MAAPNKIYVEVCEDGIFAFPEPPFAESVEYIRADLVEQPLSQERPEVDLEKEYTEFVVSDPVYSKLVNGIVGKSIARHFFEFGQSIQYQRDRREFSKLKAKEWKEGFDIGRGLTQERRKAIELVVDMLESQPSLPSDLDEAAKKIVIQLHPSMEYSAVLGDRLTIGELTKLVKAGAEWMAGQFEKYLVEPEGAWIDRNGNCFTHTLDADDPIPIKNIVGAFDIFISKKQ